MTRGQSSSLLIVALLVTSLAWAAPAQGFTIFSDSGANAASITDTVDCSGQGWATPPTATTRGR